MLPHYNTFHHNSGQARPVGGNGGSSAPSSQQQLQGMPFNPSFANSCNMLPPSMGPQPGFMNLSNNLLPMQSNHMRMPMSQFGSLGPISQPGQLGVGFCGPQNIAHNMNLAASYPINGQFGNMGQSVNQVNQTMGFLPGQLFGHNLLNLQQINQNTGPYGQFCLPNLLNRNQVVPMQMQMQMQMQNSCQGGPNYAFGGSNQAPQAAVLPNPAPFATPNFGNVHSPNQTGQQINQNKKKLVFQGTQANHVNTGGVYNSDRKSSPSKSFTKHPKRGVQPQGGFQNSQFHHMKNAKGNFAFPNGHKGKGKSNEKQGKFALNDFMNQGRERKRSLSLSYTEQEIEQWREERRKNYPSNTNIEKKLSEKMIDSEAIERVAKARREQLKEILTKQAEMGVEVAEIPSHYLSDSKKQDERVENRSWTNNGRFQNKFGKRDRYAKKDRFAKRQRSNQKDSSNDPSFSKREPTLLQKLLSSDIKRDKSRLWQVFRFMVTNSFFKDFPDKPLKFPTVVVKESVSEEGVVEELSSVAGKGAYVGREKSMVERVDNDDYKDRSDDCRYNDNHGEDEEGIEQAEEEEGEIIN